MAEWVVRVKTPYRGYNAGGKQLTEGNTAGTREARRQVEAVVREWRSSMGVRDMGRRASLWDQMYPQPIFIFEDADDPLLDWAAIWEYYEQMPALDWSLEGLSANVIGDLAHAFCNFSVKADIDREGPGFYVREPTTAPHPPPHRRRPGPPPVGCRSLP